MAVGVKQDNPSAGRVIDVAVAVTQAIAPGQSLPGGIIQGADAVAVGVDLAICRPARSKLWLVRRLKGSIPTTS